MMTSTTIRFIIKALEIESTDPETGHDCRGLVILTYDYLVTTFGYFPQGMRDSGWMLTVSVNI